jgi:hypothetical protein
MFYRFALVATAISSLVTRSSTRIYYWVELSPAADLAIKYRILDAGFQQGSTYNLSASVRRRPGFAGAEDPRPQRWCVSPLSATTMALTMLISAKISSAASVVSAIAELSAAGLGRIHPKPVRQAGAVSCINSFRSRPPPEGC